MFKWTFRGAGWRPCFYLQHPGHHGRRKFLADAKAVARQVQTPISPKSGTRKIAGLTLTSGPQPLQGTGKHVVESYSARAVPHTLARHSLHAA